MIYRIKNPQKKEWNQKQFVEAYLENEQGEEFKVSAWGGEFQDEDGMFKNTVDLELYKNDKGYWTISKPKRGLYGAGAASKLDIEEKRNSNIKENMSEKAREIAWFNSRNTALEFVKTYVSNPGVSMPSEAMEQVEQYTQIFFKQWEKWNNSPF